MRLWAETGSINSAGRSVRVKVSEMTANINRQAKARGNCAVNALRNAELEVLKGQRSGRVYRKPHTKRATYTASAPGEPPARRTGMLHLNWYGDVETRAVSKGTEILAVLESNERYASMLENGTSKTAPRPFVDKIREKAEPEIKKIYSEPYR